MQLIVIQSSGLGDILFCQKAVQLLTRRLNIKEVIWPVAREYGYLNECLYSENVKFFNEEKDFPFKKDYENIKSKLRSGFLNPKLEEFSGNLFLPLSYFLYPDSSIMESKYRFLNINYDKWEEYFEIKRDKTRELFLEGYLGVDFSQPYNLINLNFGGHPNNKHSKYEFYNKSICIKNNYKNIYMDFLGFDRIFDWISIVENATEIHSVNTSLTYIIQKLETKANLFMYNRNNKDFSAIYSQKMYSKNWSYIKYD